MAADVMNGCARQASRAQGRVSGTWYLYLIRAADSRLYTGITTDVERRLSEHRSGGARGAKALRGMAPLGLVYCREFPDRIQASRAEYRVKQLPKRQKERLVSGDLDFEAVFAGD